MRKERKDTEKFGFSDKRGRAQTSTDPYIPEEGRKEDSYCGRCHAFYRNKRWYLDEEEYRKIRDAEDAKEVVCPACRKIAEHYPEGVLTLRGDYLWQHEEEIHNILRNEEERAMGKNPLERIIRIAREGDDLVIETTEQKLAEHLGRALNKAHQGDLNVTWSDNHGVCRVSWERSA